MSDDVSRRISAGSLIGYARVSDARTQVLDRQIDALSEAGCVKVFTDQITGTRFSRPGLDDALSYLRGGDVLVVAELSRLGRRTTGILSLVEELTARGISLRILNLGITTGDGGMLSNLLLSVISAVSQAEHELLVERTRQGIAAARARGRVGGRPRSLTDAHVELGVALRDQGKSWVEIGELLGCSERTARRRIGALSVAA